ncbi:hypothetical protein F2Q69_00012625 [Brassica cretica]|uniref:Reverse transcriptase domain-containing protein n=1 Tax=Brassica cretica TaxID=69181 RepID=A0A8S9R572_BRACR|nr:hypothetical protein F2Q69_00012625 [Brassica cretica]
MSDVHASRHTGLCMSVRMRRSQVKWLTPRPDPLDQATSSFSIDLRDFGPSGEIVRDLEVQIGNSLVPVDFHVLDIKLNWNSPLLLGRAFLSTVGAVCNLQTNQLCLTLINPNAHYDPIPFKTPQTISRRINDPGIIAACHCGNEYETDCATLIETHAATSIDSCHQKSTDIPQEELVDSRPDD